MGVVCHKLEIISTAADLRHYPFPKIGNWKDWGNELDNRSEVEAGSEVSAG
jgi:hypothetical protein